MTFTYFISCYDFSLIKSGKTETVIEPWFIIDEQDILLTGVFYITLTTIDVVLILIIAAILIYLNKKKSSHNIYTNKILNEKHIQSE